MADTRHGGEHAGGAALRVLVDAETKRRFATAIDFDYPLTERYPRTARGESQQHAAPRCYHRSEPDIPHDLPSLDPISDSVRRHEPPGGAGDNGMTASFAHGLG